MIKYIKQQSIAIYIYPAGLLLFAVLVCMKAGTGLFDFPTIDSSQFIYIAKSMQNGLVPYLDIFDHKGVVLYVINYLGLCLGGISGIWIYEIISMFISMLYCYKTVLIISNNRLISYIAILCSFALLGTYFDRGNNVEEYALPFIAISLYIFTKYLFSKESSIKATYLIILGLSFGAVIMLRLDMISVWIVFCSVIVIKLIFEKKYKLLIKYITYFSMGLLIIIIPCLLYLFANNALSEFYVQYFEFNLKYSSNKGIIDSFHSLIYFSNTNLFKMTILVYLLLIANIRNFNPFIVFSGIAYLLLTILIIAAPGYTFGHYGIIIIPCFIIPVGYLLKYNRSISVKNNSLTKLIILVTIISFITYPQLINYAHYFRRSNVRIENYNSSIKTDLVRFIEANTTVNDPIIVFGNNSLIYLESKRKAASKYIYQYPVGTIDNKIATKFIEDIKNNTPKLIVDSNNNIDRTDTMAVFLKKFTNINYEKYNIGGLNVFLR